MSCTLFELSENLWKKIDEGFLFLRWHSFGFPSQTRYWNFRSSWRINVFLINSIKKKLWTEHIAFKEFNCIDILHRGYQNVITRVKVIKSSFVFFSHYCNGFNFHWMPKSSVSFRVFGAAPSVLIAMGTTFVQILQSFWKFCVIF